MTEDKSKDDARNPKRWVGCSIEEEYLGSTRKEERQERKRVSAKDRSKYKKTDQDKRVRIFDPTALEEQGLIRGRVTGIISQGIIVHVDKRRLVCELRGVLKKEKTHLKNLVAVGDFVWFEEREDNEGVIVEVEPRKTLLSRADNLSRRKEQLIATNIDQVLITVSVVNPTLKPALIDRYIIATKKGGMDPVVVINKVDLLESDEATDEDREQLKAVIEAYAQAEIPLICVSANTDEGLDALKKQMGDHSSVFSGQSGVGKTSLINAVTGLDLRVRETVAKTRKGAHTTTSAQLVRLESGGWCVDTPGIKSFGVWDLEADEIEGYFSEIHEVGQGCKFSNCTHTHESPCAVTDAVEAGTISQLRYDSYQSLIESVRAQHHRR